jgi:integrase
MLAVADSTYATYSSHFRQYILFCSKRCLPPLSPDALHTFIFACYENQDSYGKVNGTTSAIKMWCRLNGLPALMEPITSLGLRAYRKNYRRTRPPQWFTTDHINSILSTFTPLQLHQYVLLIASFYTLIRPKEILYLTYANLFLKEKYIWLTLSKTDQEGAGTYVKLLPPALDALTFLAKSIPHTPQDKIFPINQATLNPWLESKCKHVNVPTYTWYALKHGGATYLALSGWSINQIKNHGRWKTEVATRTYIHAPIHAI